MESRATRAQSRVGTKTGLVQSVWWYPNLPDIKRVTLNRINEQFSVLPKCADNVQVRRIRVMPPAAELWNCK